MLGLVLGLGLGVSSCHNIISISLLDIHYSGTRVRGSVRLRVRARISIRVIAKVMVYMPVMHPSHVCPMARHAPMCDS